MSITKKLIVTLSTLLVAGALAHAQSAFAPPPAAVYYSPSAGVWDPLTSGAGFGALGYVPPAFAAYCQTAVNQPWTPCSFSGGSGGGIPAATIPSGTINGINKVFTLAFTPSPSGSLLLFMNGILQSQTQASPDYTLSGTTVTFITAPPIGATLEAY